MPKILALTQLALAMTILLAACQQQPTIPIVTATHQQPSTKSQPSATSIPATPTVSLTSTPIPMVNPVFPIPEPECQHKDEYTGPLPPKESSAYRLKPWAEADAVAIIQQLDQVLPPCDKPRARTIGGDLEQKKRRGAIQLALVEALLRYPNSTNHKELAWHLAQVNASLYDHSSDVWLVKTIQQALNQGGYTLETLPSLLEPYGFQIPTVHLYPDTPNGTEIWFEERYDHGKEVKFIPTENLFGDGQTVQIFWLLDRYGSGGLLIAAQKNADENYTLNLLLSGFPGEIYIGDHTQDDLPEIALTTGARYGSMCVTYLYIYQWQGQYFNDLTRGGLKTEQCSDALQYQKSEQSTPDWFEFVFSENGLKNNYVWNGSFYELIDTHAEKYWLFGEVFHISDLMARGEYAATLQAINAELENKDSIARIGPSYPDYLHFQTGLVYALQSQTEAAQNEFKKLVEAPVNPRARMVSNAAQAFLSNYHSDGDIYRACQAALLVNLKAIDPYRKAGDFYSVNSQAALRILGLNPNGFNNGFEQQLCDPQIAFPQLVKNLQPSSADDISTVLQQDGVKVLNAQQVDVDGNGKQDWVIAISYPYYSGSLISIWVLLQRSTGLEALHIDESIPANRSINTLTTFKIETIALPNDAPTVFWQANRDFSAFQIFDTQSNQRVYIYYPDIPRPHTAIEQFSTQTEANTPGYQVWYLPDEYTPDWEAYQWDAKTYHFTLTSRKMSAAQIADEGPIDAAHQAKTKLLDEWQPNEAIALLKAVLETTSGKHERTSCFPDENCMERPRLRYLLGLAYELTGDEKLAAQTYWQVWHDYPASSYAMLAQAKLELVKP